MFWLLWLGMQTGAASKYPPFCEVTSHVGQAEMNWTTHTLQATGRVAPHLGIADPSLEGSLFMVSQRLEQAKEQALQTLIDALLALPLWQDQTVAQACQAQKKSLLGLREIANKQLKVMDSRVYAFGGVETRLRLPLEGQIWSTIAACLPPITQPSLPPPSQTLPTKATMVLLQLPPNRLPQLALQLRQVGYELPLLATLPQGEKLPLRYVSLCSGKRSQKKIANDLQRRLLSSMTEWAISVPEGRFAVRSKSTSAITLQTLLAAGGREQVWLVLPSS